MFSRHFFREKVSYLKNNHCDYVYVNRRTHFHVCLVTYLRKNTTEIELEFLVFFIFNNSFMKAFIQEHYLLPDCAFKPVTSLFCENCVSYFSAFLLLTYFVRSLPYGNCLLGTSSSSLAGENSLMHEHRVMKTVQLHLNIRYA